MGLIVRMLDGDALDEVFGHVSHDGRTHLPLWLVCKAFSERRPTGAFKTSAKAMCCTPALLKWAIKMGLQPHHLNPNILTHADALVILKMIRPNLLPDKDKDGVETTRSIIAMMEGPTVAEARRFNEELGGAIHFSSDVLRIPSLAETCTAVATCQPLGVVLAEITGARCDGGGGVDIMMYNIEDRLQGMDPYELTRVCVPHLRRLGFKCGLFFGKKHDECPDVPFSVNFEPMGCEAMREHITSYCRRYNYAHLYATSPGALALRAILRLSVRFVAWKNRALHRLRSASSSGDASIR